MWRNALFATFAVLTGLLLLLFPQIDFLLPYRHVLLAHYSVPFAIYTLLLAVNLFALFFVVTRHLFLKDTGRKLEHVEKQLRSGTVAQELSERLRKGESDAFPRHP
jgi:hypothetical protein